MANKEFNARIKHKRDLEENWATNNPVLLNGEIAIIDKSDNMIGIKIGDSTQLFSDLPLYVLVPGVSTEDDGKILSISNGSVVWSAKAQYTIEPITQEEYDALETKDSNTLYIIEV